MATPHATELLSIQDDGRGVRKMLAQFGLSTETQPITPARAPPELEFAG